MKAKKLEPSNAAKLLDVETLEGFAALVAAKASSAAAADVRREARRSIKRGGEPRGKKAPPKSEWTRLGFTSRPGDPPLSHKGTLKNAIRYARRRPDEVVVGPEKDDGIGDAPRTLERGGRGRVVSVKYSASYLARATRKKKRSRTADFSPPCRKHGTARVTRPKAERPYTVYGEDGRFATIRDYRYFYSREEWEAARDSPGFLSWAKTARRRVEARVPVAPRPYMAPALAKTSSPEVAEPRLARIVKAAAREFVGGGKPKTKGRKK